MLPPPPTDVLDDMVTVIVLVLRSVFQRVSYVRLCFDCSMGCYGYQLFDMNGLTNDNNRGCPALLRVNWLLMVLQMQPTIGLACWTASTG
mmetsp:Transcript_2701/g.5910  ORF Transcript_2701/g.5910 Transcript_2701/m.5910 type:complete len:90 (-) Transcript_2701:16-285(-)